MYLEALARSPGVSRRIVCGFRTAVHFADVQLWESRSRDQKPRNISNSKQLEHHNVSYAI
jgi:hypothetical protein